jgi:glycosyltransferase involved in cell wall biosynthesis
MYPQDPAMPMRKLVLADRYLYCFGGHDWELDTTIARLFAARGWKVSILARGDIAGAATMPGAEIIAWFAPPSVRGRSKIHRMLPRRLLATFKHLYGKLHRNPDSGYGRDCLRGIEKLALGALDIFLIPTIHAGELISLGAALAGARAADLPAFHIVLRREPEEVAMAHFPAALAALKPYMGKIFFHADTEALSEAYRHYGISVTTMPVLCDFASIHNHRRPPSREARKLAFLGGARTEKGFHFLPEMIQQVRRIHPCGRELEFHIHAFIATGGENPDIADTLQKLACLPNITLYKGDLPQDAYLDLLAAADIVLLPYDAKVYPRRSSGILVQALAAGKVAIIPEGTWFSDTAPEGAVQRFAPGQFTQAVLAALDDFPALQAKAEAFGCAVDFAAIEDEFYRIATGL